MNQQISDTTPRETIRAARYTGPQSIVVEDHALEGPAAGEVTLEVNACGVCGSDVHFYSGRWPQPSVSPGHEIVGTVTAVGDGVTDWKIGDWAVVEPILACGHCWFCQRGETNRCAEMKFLSVHRDGGFASAVNAPVNCLLHVPPELPDTLAVLTEPFAVALHACRAAHIAPGDTVVVCGAGSIGLLSIAAALEQGAAKVICSARHPQQIEAAARLGASPVTAEELEAAATAATRGRGADVVIETVGGAGQAVGQALSAVRTGGTVVLVGGFTRPTSLHLSRVVNREVHLVGSNCYSRRENPTDFQMALSVLASGRYPLETLVTHRFGLEEIGQALGAASDKSSGAIKVQVLCG